MTRILVPLTLLCCLAPLGAQATIIVDQAGGTGTNYRKLEDAIAGAKSGDILIVRAGRYNFPTTTVSKPLTIQGVGPTTDVWGQVARITGIPAGQSFVMKDLKLTPQWAEAKDCRGEVVFDGIDTLFLLSISAVNCTAVTVRQCRRCRLDVRGSFVQVHGSTVVGPYSLLALSSTVDIVDTTIDGGLHPGHSGTYPATAVTAANSEIRVRGRGSSVSVRLSPSYAPIKYPFVGDAGSTLVLDPVVTVIQPNATAAIQGFGRGVRRPTLPTLGSTVVPQLGKAWTYTLTGRANDVYAIAIGLPLPPTPFLGDFLRVDPQAMVVLQVGRLGSTGAATHQVVHGSKLVYRGHLFMMQGVAGSGPSPTNGLTLSVR